MNATDEARAERTAVYLYSNLSMTMRYISMFMCGRRENELVENLGALDQMLKERVARTPISDACACGSRGHEVPVRHRKAQTFNTYRQLVSETSACMLLADAGVCPVENGRIDAAELCRASSIGATLPSGDEQVRKPASPGVRRQWHDLDRAEAMMAHLFALDEQLRS